jgi:hypothetical protein
MSYVDNYKYGCFLSNHCKVDAGLLENVVPFEVIHKADEKLPLPPKAAQKMTFKVSKYAKFVSKTENMTKIYELHTAKFQSLHQNLTTTNTCHTLQHVILNDKDTLLSTYIVKVVPVVTWRDVYTAEKELRMTNMVYKSSFGQFHGSDITCKPFFGCVFWNGKKWKYVSVWEKASGLNLSKIRKPSIFQKGFDKSKILKSVASAVKTLWMLGYAHNDLHEANLCYDFKTNKIKIIDFEMAVRMPSDVTNELRRELEQNTIGEVKQVTEKDCNEFAKMFHNIGKEMAISLLTLAKDVCYVNADADNLIYNTDEYLLPVLFERL